MLLGRDRSRLAMRRSVGDGGRGEPGEEDRSPAKA
jgi:hypothetical protein